MGAYASSEPITPFHVKPVFLKGIGEKPDEASHAASDARSSSGTFGNDGFGWLHLLALPVFLALYILVERYPALAGASVLLLFACLLYRLLPVWRRLVVAPVAFATLLLVRRVVTFTLVAAAPVLKNGAKIDSGLSWLPLFFAVAIFYMPRRPTYSGNFFFGGAILLLTSGLLPGDGFVAVFTAMQYFLFIALLIVLAIDFTQPVPAPPKPVES
jgi:hypothetical protein